MQPQIILAYLIFSNMINVGAMDSHNLEHQEYTDRIKLYSQRLQQQWNNVQHPSVIPKGMLIPFETKCSIIFCLCLGPRIKLPYTLTPYGYLIFFQFQVF